MNFQFMLKNLFEYKFRILGVLALIIVLACVRAFENDLFYDPFLIYFQSNYQNINLPAIDNFRLFINLFFRYFLNSVVSIAIIYFIFNDLQLLKFAFVLYILFFILLILTLYLAVGDGGTNNKMTIFYIRRFLVQPVLLMLFVTGFYFQKKSK